jgi:hypothetical protein
MNDMSLLLESASLHEKMYIYHRFDGIVQNSFLLLIEQLRTYELKKSATLPTQISLNI